MLIENCGKFVPGELFSKVAGISRAGVWKQISDLRKRGFIIDASIRKGYCLSEVPDVLFAPVIQAGLETRGIAKEIFSFDTIDSTNRIAKEFALSGVTDGALVVADHQSRGRGRMNRSWLSTPGTNILCSLIFYPPLDTSSIFRLTMMTSVAVVRAIERQCGLRSQIKWPNDIYLNKKKICGILTEFSADFDRILHAVVGIGINVNFKTGGQSALKDIATSLCEVLGKEVPRLALLKAILEEIDTGYTALKDHGNNDLRMQWEQYSMILNRPVSVIAGDKTINGTVAGITDNGHLMLVDTSGAQQEILCGDVSLRL